jgi:hypothetical protein
MRIRGQVYEGNARARGDERTGVTVEVDLEPDVAA